MAAYFDPQKTVLHSNIGALNAPEVKQLEHGKIFVNEAQKTTERGDFWLED